MFAAKERTLLMLRAAIVAAGTLASRLLGLLRDIVLAACFRREETDAFFVAFTIPNALRQILGEGAISGAVIPALSKELDTKGEAEAQSLFAKIRAVSLLALLVTSAAGCLLAFPVTMLFASEARVHPGQFERTAELTRTVFPYLFFAGSTALGAAALNASKKFGIAAFAPALLNVGFLICAIGLPSYFKARGIDPAQAMVAGALLGGVLQVAVQLPALQKAGYLKRPQLDLRDARVTGILKRIAPMFLGTGVYYIDLILSRQFLAGLPQGSQSYFTWASRLVDFPQGIFVMAISTAALPSLSLLAAKEDKSELRSTFAYGMRLSLFVAIPCSVVLIALGEELVTLLFAHGAFGRQDAAETARSLWFQGGAIFAVTGVRQATSAFYALGDTKTPVWISIADLMVFLVLAIALRAPLGHAGVSAAVGGSSLAQMVLLLWFLRKPMGGIAGKEVLSSASKVVFASLLAGLSAYGASGWLGRGALGAIVGMFAFSVVFLLAAYGAKCTELDAILLGLKKKLARRRTSSSQP
jgi:putative peptidoglycan lipid II flippase